MLKILARAVDDYFRNFGVWPKEIIVSRYNNGISNHPTLNAIVISRHVWADIREEDGGRTIPVLVPHNLRMFGCALVGGNSW